MLSLEEIGVSSQRDRALLLGVSAPLSSQLPRFGVAPKLEEFSGVGASHLDLGVEAACSGAGVSQRERFFSPSMVN